MTKRGSTPSSTTSFHTGEVGKIVKNTLKKALKIFPKFREFKKTTPGTIRMDPGGGVPR